jgi:type VI secretion system secreted protein Hcp
MFIKMDGIDGESRDSGHEGEIDVLAWSWGMSQSGSMHSGGGGGAGKVSIQDISFTKFVDKATGNLMLACAQGAHIAEAVLVVRKAGTSPLEYLVITMSRCLITSVSTGGSGGEDRLTENVTINFGGVKVEYQEQQEDGSGVPGPEFAWNIETNEAA